MKSGRFEGRSIHMTKFVECPVVDKVPLRDSTFEGGRSRTSVVVVESRGQRRCIQLATFQGPRIARIAMALQTSGVNGLQNSWYHYRSDPPICLCRELLLPTNVVAPCSLATDSGTMGVSYFGRNRERPNGGKTSISRSYQRLLLWPSSYLWLPTPKQRNTPECKAKCSMLQLRSERCRPIYACHQLPCKPGTGTPLYRGFVDVARGRGGARGAAYRAASVGSH